MRRVLIFMEGFNPDTETVIRGLVPENVKISRVYVEGKHVGIAFGEGDVQFHFFGDGGSRWIKAFDEGGNEIVPKFVDYVTNRDVLEWLSDFF